MKMKMMVDVSFEILPEYALTPTRLVSGDMSLRTLAHS